MGHRKQGFLGIVVLLCAGIPLNGCVNSNVSGKLASNAFPWNVGGTNPGPSPPNPTTCPTLTGVAPSTATAIAHWGFVPYQTFSGEFYVGVFAAHHRGIQRVEFRINDGPPILVCSPAPNPGTVNTRTVGVPLNVPLASNYWIRIYASDYPDGPVSIRATAFPHAGQPKTVLFPTSAHANAPDRDRIFLNANSQGTLATPIRYVTKTGSDSVNRDCQSIATACLTLQRAVQSFGQSSPGSSTGSIDVGGGEIQMGEGMWNFPTSVTSPGLQANLRWLNLTSIPTADPNNVLIRPYQTGGIHAPNNDNVSVNVPGFGIKLLKLSRVKIVGPVGQSGVSIQNQRFLWIDNSIVSHLDVNASGQPMQLHYGLIYDENGNSCQPGCQNFRAVGGWKYQGAETLWTATFLTNSYVDNHGRIAQGAELAMNVFGDRTASGYSTGAATLVNVSVKTIFGSQFRFPTPGGGFVYGPDYHGDFYQWWDRLQDVFIYGMRTVYDGTNGYVSSRGIAGGNPGFVIKDIAIFESNVDTTTYPSLAYTVGQNGNPNPPNTYPIPGPTPALGLSLVPSTPLGSGIKVGVAYSVCATATGNSFLEHIVTDQLTAVPAANICGESNPALATAANITNILYRNSTFLIPSGAQFQQDAYPRPWNHSGVTIE